MQAVLCLVLLRVLASAGDVEESSAALPTSGLPTTSTSKPEENDYASAFPEPPVCGVSQGTFSRVVHGTNGNLGDFPWIALIAYRGEKVAGFFFRCGASLITAQHALTAAHCIHGLEDILYFVRLGELDFTDHSQNKPVDALVKTTVKHENYSTDEVTNDIGLLILHRQLKFTDGFAAVYVEFAALCFPVHLIEFTPDVKYNYSLQKFSDYIRPICLPLSDDLRTKDFVDYRPFIAGWGRTSYKGPQASRLQVLQVPVVSRDSCKLAYADSVLSTYPFDERILCAGGETGRDACNGDSGGPLMQPIWNPTNYTTYFYQIGVVSLGMKCATVAGFPSVYTRVAQFIPWIQKHVLGPNIK